MSRARKNSGSDVVPTALDAALSTMSAEALKEVVHQAIPELVSGRMRAGGSGWGPAAVFDEQVAEVSCDSTSETMSWAASIKAEYSRFPALRGELDRAPRAP